MKERDEARAALERAAANPAAMAPPAAVPASTAEPMDEEASGADVGISEAVKVCALLSSRLGPTLSDHSLRTLRVRSQP
jgi:hypothetical protein